MNQVALFSVIFTDIVGFSKLVNSEQIQVKKTFIEMWNKALENVKPEDIIVIDTGDGAILASLRDPELPLKVGISLKSQIQNSPSTLKISLRIGIHFGPGELATDMNGNKTILGDGINSGQRIMSFAQPGQILISKPYLELIKPLSYHYKDIFAFAGQQADKFKRYHEVYKYLDDEIVKEQQEEGITKAPIQNKSSILKIAFIKLAKVVNDFLDLFKTIFFKIMQLIFVLGIIYEAITLAPLLPNVAAIQNKIHLQGQYLIGELRNINSLAPLFGKNK